MKRSSLVAVTTAMLLGTTACGQAVAPTSTSSAGQTEVEAETSAVTESASAETTMVEKAVDDIEFPLKDEVTLTVWQPFSNTIIDTMEENPVIDLIKEKTGVSLKFIHPAQGEEKTALQLMLASDDLPDIIRLDAGLNGNLSYPGGGEKGVQDGVILQLNDLIDKYAPNYQAIRARGGAYQKDTIADDGTMWAMYTVSNDANEAPWNGICYRKDWADELGIDAPVTLDDWHDMLTAFKEKKGADCALMIPNRGITANNEFLSAFNVGRDFYQVEGTVKYGYIEDGMRSYAELMHQWYTEGLIDQSFATNPDFTGDGFVIPPAYFADGRVGAGNTSWAGSGDGFYSLYRATDDPNVNFAAVIPPVQKEGDETHFRCTTTPISFPWVVTTACKTPEIAVKFLDWCYSEEGELVLNYGNPANYTVKDGDKPHFNDDFLFNDTYDFPTMLSAYTWENGPGVRDYARAYQNVPSNLLDSCDVWANCKADYVMPSGVELTEEEGDENSVIMADINTYVEDSLPKCITGDLSMDQWDDFVAQIKAMNIDRAIELHQQALDRYNNR